MSELEHIRTLESVGDFAADDNSVQDGAQSFQELEEEPAEPIPRSRLRIFAILVALNVSPMSCFSTGTRFLNAYSFLYSWLR